MPQPDQRSGPLTRRGEGAEVDAGQADHQHDTRSTRPDTFTDPDPPTGADRAEAALLGAGLLSFEARVAIAEQLDGVELARHAHQVVADTIVALHRAGDPVDAVTLTDRLVLDGRLDEAGGPQAISALASPEVCPTAAAWPAYLAIVVREARRRNGIQVLRRALGRLEGGADPDQVLAELGVVS